MSTYTALCEFSHAVCVCNVKGVCEYVSLWTNLHEYSAQLLYMHMTEFYGYFRFFVYNI